MNKHFSDNLSAKLAVAGIWVTNFCIVIATLFSLSLVTAAFGFFGFLLGTFGAIISTTLWWTRDNDAPGASSYGTYDNMKSKFKFHSRPVVN